MGPRLWGYPQSLGWLSHGRVRRLEITQENRSLGGEQCRQGILRPRLRLGFVLTLLCVYFVGTALKIDKVEFFPYLAG